MKKSLWALAAGVAATMATAPGPGYASSHREAPFISGLPEVDGTDFYMFRSYEPGRSDFVTLIANYNPLQDPSGGPNYSRLDPNAVYEIEIDNNGDGKEDITFQFKFSNAMRGFAVNAGGKNTAIPLINKGQVGANGTRTDIANLNFVQTYTVGIIRGPRRNASPQLASDGATGSPTFAKPADYGGTRSLPNYAAYARDHIRPIAIPGCSTQGRVFVGQRKEGFAANLGAIFDLMNTQAIGVRTVDGAPPSAAAFTPVGEANAKAGSNSTENKSVTSIALEVPIACLIRPGQPIIGAWTTSALPRTAVLNSPQAVSMPTELRSGPYVQVSRVGMPLVNAVIIGLPDKDRWNGSEPSEDGQFMNYITNPSLPELLEILFGPNGTVAKLGIRAPNRFPRDDLVATFLTGLTIPGVVTNRPPNIVPSEMLRLNTSTAVKAAAAQDTLGVIGGDAAGFPNGRRPGDDTVDIELRVAMGRLIALGLFGAPTQAPSGNLDFVDGARLTATDFDSVFPYLKAPLPGDRIP